MIHPLCTTVAERAQRTGDSSLRAWATLSLPMLLRHATMPAKGVLAREVKLITERPQDNPLASWSPAQIKGLEKYSAQPMSAHLLAAVLPAADLADMLKASEEVRLLMLIGLTLHDANKADPALNVEPKEVPYGAWNESSWFTPLSTLAKRWGLQPLIEVLASLMSKRLNIAPEQAESAALAAAYWVARNTETKNASNRSPKEFGLEDKELWDKIRKDLDKAACLSRVGDLCASHGSTGESPQVIAQNPTLRELIRDLCTMFQRKKLVMTPWTMSGLSGVGASFLNGVIQRSLEKKGHHIWLVGSHGGVTLSEGSELPSREEVMTEGERSLHELIERRMDDLSAEPMTLAMMIIAGGLPHQKRVSLATQTLKPEEQFRRLSESACNLYSNEEKAANSAITVAHVLQEFLSKHEPRPRQEGAPALKFPKQGIQFCLWALEKAPEDLYPAKERWMKILMDAPDNYKSIKSQYAKINKAHSEQGGKKDASEYFLARAIASGVKAWLADHELQAGTPILMDILADVITDQVQFGSQRAQLNDLRTAMSSAEQGQACWKCGKNGAEVSASEVKGTVVLSGYSARNRPEITATKASICSPCAFSEILRNTVDVGREPGKDLYLHVSLPGYVSPLQQKSMIRLTRLMMKRQPWRLLGTHRDRRHFSDPRGFNVRQELHELLFSGRDTTDEEKGADHDLLLSEMAQQALNDLKAALGLGNAEESPELDEDIEEELDSWDDLELDLSYADPFKDASEQASPRTDADKGSEKAEKDLQKWKESLKINNVRLIGGDGDVPTQWTLRLDAKDYEERVVEAWALTISTSLLIPGAHAELSMSPEPARWPGPVCARLQTRSNIWNHWVPGGTELGYYELGQALRALEALKLLTELRHRSKNVIKKNGLMRSARSVSLVSGVLNTNMVGSGHDIERTKSFNVRIIFYAQNCLSKARDHFNTGADMNQNISRIELVHKVMKELYWGESVKSSTHARTRPLRMAIDGLCKNARTGQSSGERDEAIQQAAGQISGILKKDRSKALEYVKAVNEHMLEGMCKGSVDQLRMKANDLIRATDLMQLMYFKELKEQKKAREAEEKAQKEQGGAPTETEASE